MCKEGPNTGRCASEEAGPQKGVDSEIPHQLGRRTRRLSLKLGWTRGGVPTKTNTSGDVPAKRLSLRQCASKDTGSRRESGL